MWFKINKFKFIKLGMFKSNREFDFYPLKKEKKKKSAKNHKKHLTFFKPSAIIY